MRAGAGALGSAYKQARRRAGGFASRDSRDMEAAPLLATAPAAEREREPSPQRAASLEGAPRRSGLGAGQPAPRPVPSPTAGYMQTGGQLTPPHDRRRLLSLDIARGLTIALMLFVNHAGSSPWWLAHAEWDGVHLADFVMPGFLVIMGASIPLSLAAQRDRGQSRRQLLVKAAVRAAKLFAMGLFIQGGVATGRFPSFDLATLRIMGVLQRVALCFLAVSLAAVWLVPRRRELKGLGAAPAGRPPPELGEAPPAAPAHACQVRLWALAGAVLASYTALSAGVRAPGCAAGGPFSAACNLAAWVDALLLRREHMYPYSACRAADPPCAAFDPEGLWTTLGGAMSSTAAGAALGAGFLAPQPPAARTRALAGAGTAAVVAGLAFSTLGLPLNKNLWSGSFVLLTLGATGLCLAACHWGADERKSGAFRAVTMPLTWLGTNPIAVYFGDEVLELALPLVYWRTPDNNLRDWLWRAVLARALGPGPAGRLAGAAADMLLWTAVASWLYRRRIFLKV